ncbi:MAG: flavodoxin family protein [Prevotellaceae bacterium]|jgi:multimeric flavodoxin WrbA|nr:flavodoxin family protein [Prevotellaceae bacterium]
MKKREFLKAAGLVGATIAMRESADALIKCSEQRRLNETKKIVAINGSPHENGNTAYALSVMGEVFEQAHVDFEIIHLGKSEIRGCIACNSCRLENRDKGCLYATEEEKEWIETMKAADAIILASPCFFGGMAGTLKSFLDRVFFSESKNFRYKTGASVVTAKRSGASMTFENLNKYFTISEMPLASSTYWNNMRGLSPDDLKQDGEGIRTLQNLAKNVIKLIQLKIES